MTGLVSIEEMRLQTALYDEYLQWCQHVTISVSPDFSAIYVWPYNSHFLNHQEIIFKESSSIYLPFTFKDTPVHPLTFKKRAQI